MKPNEDLVNYLRTKGLVVTEENCDHHDDSIIRLTNVMENNKEIQKQRKRHLENLRKV